MINAYRDDFIYDVIIMIHHPREIVGRITSELGSQPTSSGQAGEKRQTRSGRPMPGVYKETNWWQRIQYKADRHFFRALEEQLEKLEAAREYLYGLIASGGSVTLTINLSGQMKISDVLSTNDLMRLTRIGVDLGIEAFPRMKE